MLRPANGQARATAPSCAPAPPRSVPRRGRFRYSHRPERLFNPHHILPAQYQSVSNLSRATAFSSPVRSPSSNSSRVLSRGPRRCSSALAASTADREVTRARENRAVLARRKEMPGGTRQPPCSHQACARTGRRRVPQRPRG